MSTIWRLYFEGRDTDLTVEGVEAPTLALAESTARGDHDLGEEFVLVEGLPTRFSRVVLPD